MCTRGIGLAFALLALPSFSAAEKITFKPVVAAVLKIDQRPVKFWNVYKATKNEDLILVQLGSRHLVLDAELREVTEIPPEQFQRKGRELQWDRRSDSQARRAGEKVLPSEDWNVREAGPVRIIRVRLTGEGRVIEVQLPLWER